jgi:hypothetical protein
MPTILPQDEGPGVDGAVDSSIVASVKMGNKHCRKADSGARQLYVRSNCSQVFHKMDQSKAAHECELRNNKKIPLAKHNLPVSGTQAYNSGQREVLRQCNVQGIMSIDRHEGHLCISVPPTIKWSNQKSNEENIGGREERKMGEGHANGSVEP